MSLQDWGDLAVTLGLMCLVPVLALIDIPAGDKDDPDERDD